MRKEEKKSGEHESLPQISDNFSPSVFILALIIEFKAARKAIKVLIKLFYENYDGFETEHAAKEKTINLLK